MAKVQCDEVCLYAQAYLYHLFKRELCLFVCLLVCLAHVCVCILPSAVTTGHFRVAFYRFTCTYHYLVIQTHFHTKGFAIGLVLK